MMSLAIALWIAHLLSPTFVTAQPRTQPCFVVRRSTILAFFPPVNGKDYSDSNEALTDFQFYAAHVRDPLSKMGIEFKEVYVTSFCVTNGGNTVSFTPLGENVGYYFVRPGKKARIEYGVKTDAEIQQRARDYFGIAVK